MKKLANFSASCAAIALFILLGAAAGAAQTTVATRPQPDITINSATKTEVIDAILKRLNDSYVFPETAKKMETAMRERVGKKEYDSIASAQEFAKKLTEDLQAVSRDKHLRVRFSPEPIPVRAERNEPTAEEKENYKRYVARVNHGFEKVERLQGNIGYIEIMGFMDPELGAETVAAALNFVANTDALIIDLRRNGGGDPAMVALLCSYFFGNQPVHLNSLYWREGDKTEEFWTKATVAGKRYEGKDVYVLTSNRTFSGAEEFSYNMKNLKRATIIGETTGGGAHPGTVYRITENFGMFVPTGRAISPVTKTNWEGTGVKPDVDVPKEQALKTAYLTALNKSLEKAANPNLKDDLKNLIEKTQKELDELKAAKKAGAQTAAK